MTVINTAKALWLCAMASLAFAPLDGHDTLSPGERVAMARHPAKSATWREFYRDIRALTGDSVLNGSETALA
jgi:hypothetical protein